MDQNHIQCVMNGICNDHVGSNEMISKQDQTKEVSSKNMKLKVGFKSSRKRSSLPNLKAPALYDTQTQTVKFDLSNINKKDILEEEGAFSKSLYQDISKNDEDFERKRLFNKKQDDECSSHLTSGPTFSDTETLGNAV